MGPRGAAEQSVADDPSAPAKPRSILFRNRNFALLWSGESISLLGSEVSVIALPSLAVLVFGEGALGVGALVALQWIPYVLLGPLMGVFTDRLRRKPLMQVANVARFVILGSLPLAAALNHLTVAHLYAAALLKGVFDVVFQLAYQAYLPQLLAREDLIDGNAKTQLSRSTALVLGRSFGGGLVSWLGAARAITADAVSYLVSSLALAFVRHQEPQPRPAQRGVAATVRDLKGGIALTFGNRLLRSLTLMATFGNMAVSLTLAMIIVFAYDDLGFSGGRIGLALGVGAVTTVVGAVLSRRINERLGMGRTLILTHALLGLAFVLLPVASSAGKGLAFVVIVVSQAISSFTTPVANVSIMTMIQKATPPQAMGRVGGVSLPLVWGANAVGPLLGSAVAALASVRLTFFFAAVLAWCAVVWILLGSVQRITDDVPEELRVPA
ncbi:MFS transporter [Streptomyces sp. AF1A]|jgi:MFS family permease|uniref:MFS transporter n=1 Tax=Streptomyces sp. AF1A TaxID=3394350 RepID=UPI0039BC6A9A